MAHGRLWQRAALKRSAVRAQGVLLQIFTKPLSDRPTVFMEIIQRIGCEQELRGPAGTPALGCQQPCARSCIVSVHFLSAAQEVQCRTGHTARHDVKSLVLYEYCANQAMLSHGEGRCASFCFHTLKPVSERRALRAANSSTHAGMVFNVC